MENTTVAKRCCYKDPFYLCTSRGSPLGISVVDRLVLQGLTGESFRIPLEAYNEFLIRFEVIISCIASEFVKPQRSCFDVRWPYYKCKFHKTD
jgi:hypothetical protein